jgi:type II secretion system protein D
MARAKTTSLLAGTLLACAGLALSVHARQSPPSAPPLSPAPPGEATPSTAQPAPAPTPTGTAPSTVPAPVPTLPAGSLRFNFKDAPVDQVLDYLARESGLPVIYEAEIPKGEITFVGASPYTFDDALSIVNLNLRRFGVHLRKQDQFLYLASLADSSKKPTQVNRGDVPVETKPDQFVTLTIPLDNARADIVAEQIKPLVSAFGGVVSVPAQNIIVVVESAAQAKRIKEIVTAIDAVRPVDSAFRIFPMKNASADTVLIALRTLMGERTKTFVVEKDGSKREVQDQQLVGVNLASDPRTNSILAVGPLSKIQSVEQLVTLLDVPESAGGDSKMTTFTLASVAPDVAAQRLTALFSSLDPKLKPVIIPLPEARKVSIVGKGSQIKQAHDLIAQLDPGAVEGMNGSLQHRTSTIPLRHIKPTAIEQIAGRLLSPAQQQSIRFAATPDQAGIIVSGPADDVGVFEQLVAGLDVQGQGLKDVRQLRIATGDPAAIVAKAEQLYTATGASQREPVSLSLDKPTRTLTIIGSPGAVAEFDRLVRSSQEARAIDQEVRKFDVQRGRATDIAARASRLARALLTPTDGTPYEEPTIEGFDDAKAIVVRAKGDQMQTLASLIERNDVAGERGYRIIPVTSESASALRDRAMAIYEKQYANVPNVSPIDVNVDREANALHVSADADGMRRFTGVLDELQRLSGGAREVRLVPVRRAEPAKIVEALRDLTTAGDVLRPWLGKGAAPAFEPVESVKAILVAAPVAQLPLIEQAIREFDQSVERTNVQVQVFRIVRGDANSIANAIRTAIAPLTRPGDTPPSVTPEAGSNSIVVAADAEAMAKARELVESMDEMGKPDRVGVRSMYLKFVRAETIAPVLENLLTRESVVDQLSPRDRAAFLRQNVQQGPSNRVRVAAERRTNAIIVSGPQLLIDAAEQLIKEIDVDPSQHGAVSRSVRILTLQNADANQMAANIQGVFAEEAGGEPAPTVRVDAASNSLILHGTDKQLATVEQLAATLDAAAVASSRQMRLVPVDRSRVSAEVLAATLKSLLERQGGLKVEVVSTEELLKRREDAGKNDALKSEEKKSGALDLAPASPSRLNASVGDVVLWSAIAVSEPEAAKPAADADEPPLTIAVDPATNTLLLVGSSRLTDRATQLAAQLEQQLPPKPAGVHVVTMPSGVDVRALAEIVQQTISQLQGVGGRGGAVSSQVRLMPDPSGTSLIVVANDEDFATVGGLIASLTQAEKATQVSIKVYPLQSITAQRAMTAIRDLFLADPRGWQARRIRTLEMKIGDAPAAKIDATQIRVTANPGGSSIIVAAPPEALPAIDSLIQTLDQSVVKDLPAIKRYDLRHAQATDLARTMQQLFDAQRQGGAAWDVPGTRFIADERTNSLLVTASESQHADVRRLLETADASADDKDLELAMIAVRQANPSAVQRLVEDVLVGKDPGRREKLRISAQDGSSLLIVRATKDEIEHVRAIVAQIDSAETAALPIRSLKLDRADAQTTAAALTKFFTDRARLLSRPGQNAQPKVAIAGDRRSGTLIIAAGDEDFEQVRSLVATFDAPAPAQDMQFKVIPLKNARVSDVGETIQSIVSELQWERTWGRWRGGNQEDKPEDRLLVETNERTNSVVVFGQGELMNTVERVIGALDQPASDRAALVVRTVALRNADLAAVKGVLERALATPGWRSWRGPDPDGVQVEIDRRGRALVLMGKSERVQQAITYAGELDSSSARGDQQTETLTLQHAKAESAAQSLRQFFAERARAQGVGESPVTIIGSANGNALIVAGDAESLKTLRDLVGQIDQPELGKDRRIEVYVVQNANATEIAPTLRGMFAKGARAEDQVIITPMASTNSLVISAPTTAFAQVEGLLKQLDAPPSAEQANWATITLSTARAQDVATALRAAMPASIKVTITPVARTNSLLVTGSKETIQLVMDKIKQIDQEPIKSLTEFRRFVLKHADASDLSWTISQMLSARRQADGDLRASIDYSRADNTLIVSATPDQIAEIEKMLGELDKPAATTRKTEFVKLEFANAEQTSNALKVFYGRYAPEAATPGARAVTIVADPASNSLVISADELEWAGITALLAKLDTKDYDTTRQLAVIPLVHADASSIARALNEGFRAPLEDRLRADRARANQPRANSGRPEEVAPPAILVDAAGMPIVTAEVQTNSLIVFAGRRELDRIEQIVKQLDVSGFDSMPQARIIPLKSGKPSQVASMIRELFLNQKERVGGPRSVLILGDDQAGALIVRAADDLFAQIKALADTLQEQGEIGRASPHVIRLRNVAAGRLRTTLLATFTEIARTQGETLAIEADRTSNAIVVACSPRLLDQIKPVIEELDRGEGNTDPQSGTPALGQVVVIADVKNNSPEQIRQQLEAMGLTRPQPQDRPGLVSEPITISVMSSRTALAILAAPGDGDAVRALVKALDAEPIEAGQQVGIVALKQASATPLVNTLNAMLRPADANTAATGQAKALAEHIRRLSLQRTGVDQSELALDISKPIRIVPDVDANSVVLISTPANVLALREIVATLDTLPVGDAVVIRIFTLENASAIRAQQVIDRLFAEGEALRRLPGTQRRGLPTTSTGRALAGEIATTVDERTNALIVAGREEAVALVEVLMKDLDQERAGKWIEPSIIRLQHADAADLARKLREILVLGMATTPEAAGLQRQYGRLRMLQDSKAPDAPDARVQADLFAPVSGLVVTAEENLNAIIVVGTPGNAAVIKELVRQLDVEAAAAANSVRFFPLKHASADRVAGLVRDIFRQRQAAGTGRPEDAVVISADMRTNSLIASTSAKSFSILEGLLKNIDTPETNYAVGLHVLPVEGADARLLAPKIDRLMRERIQASASQGGVRNALDAFSIDAEPANNLLIVACSDENLQVVKDLIDALTKDAARISGAERTEIIQLSKSRAPEVATSLDQLYVKKEAERRGQGAVSVLSNERLNALIVSGSERDITEIRALAARLDGAHVQAVRQVKPIELKSANALEVTRLIESVLAGTPVGGGRGVGARQATRLQFIRRELASVIADQQGVSPTEADLDGAIKDQVTITPDIRTNTVWITAPAPVLTLISEMVEEQERTSAGSRRIEYFTLKNSDARQMADVLRDTFNLRQQGNSLVLVPNRPLSSEPAPDADAPPESAPVVNGTTLTAVPDERQQLSIAIDARTNTLIVSGSQDYLDLVSKLVRELDGIEATEREARVYHLRNSKAKEIEKTLADYFRGENTLERTTLGPRLTGSLMRQLEQEVTVVGDEKSNKLVISTSPRYMETVLTIVRELDRPPPQVMIEVLLAEVTLDTARSWGMDAKIGPIGGDMTRIGYTAVGAGVTSAIGVPNFAVSSAEFQLLVRALESQGKLEVLSNPQVMAKDNEEAQIQVGENVPIVNGVERFAQGNSQATIERKDVGIILKVTPSISPDGFVQMKINPEISTLTARTVQVGSDISAPIISKRTVDTRVTVKDGQSVIIGGLIQTSEERRRSKVPILGDIPILGLPFRTYNDTSIKTELIVILTPRVIEGNSDLGSQQADDIRDRMLERMDDPTKIQDYFDRRQREDSIKPPAQQTYGPDAVPIPAPVNSTPAANRPMQLPR